MLVTPAALPLTPISPRLHTQQALDKNDSGFYAHPHLAPARDPSKGRMIRAAASIPGGTTLLADVSYATVPVTSSPETESLICSNPECSRRVPLQSHGRKCARNCDRHVIWCSSVCRDADQVRHEYECPWLRRLGSVVRSQESGYDFITLWHVVRLLSSWATEVRKRGPSTGTDTTAVPDRRFAWNWDAVVMCCDYLDSWPEVQTQHWQRLVTTYLDDKALLPCTLDAQQLLSLLCKEETNTFGLYGSWTGPHRLDKTVQPRGEAYALGLYPRAAMFNHSCQPNMSHKPDLRGRMVFVAARDIAEGEECTITYCDLAAHVDVGDRQRLVQEQFRFRCTCERCHEEEAQDNLAGMDTLPLGFL